MTAPLWPPSWGGNKKLSSFNHLMRLVGALLGSNQGSVAGRDIRGSREGPRHVVRA